ncbi:MAG: helix-turn-helix transcriptional regulator [Candidatus Micrarchaeota archaeon]|nr:helix-turn-helix transcriptional regulator [Candidatus Micrarchaeota archaeon]
MATSKNFNSGTCPVIKTVGITSKKWIILVILVIGNADRLRYGEIMKKLNGITPKSLADTLKDLEKLGLVKRRAFNDIPPRVEYTLTKEGFGLYRATIPLLEWAAEKTGDKECGILKTALSKKVRIQ